MDLIKKIGSKLYAWWMSFARGLAFVNTRVLLTLVYVIIIGPIAILMRLAGKDSLHRKLDSSPSYWKRREISSHTVENAARQF